MAAGGSGDVLTGIIAGLCAQGMSAEEAAVLGVWIHGKAGEYAAAKLSDYSMTADSIISSIPEVMKELIRIRQNITHENL